MIHRYGKDVDMRRINRNLDKLKGLMDKCEEDSKNAYIAPVGEAKCRLCGSGDISLFMSTFDMYDYYECNSCEALFLWNLPDIKRLYTDSSSANTDSYIDENVYLQRVEMISKPKTDFVLEVCDNNGISPKRWVDIGCGGVRSYII